MKSLIITVINFCLSTFIFLHFASESSCYEYSQNKSQPSTTSLLNQLSQLRSRCPDPCPGDTLRVSILLNIIESINDDNVWPAYNKQVMEICKKNIPEVEGNLLLFYRKSHAMALNNAGYLSDIQGNIPQALSFYQKSIDIHQSMGDKQGMAIGYNNVGYIYNNQGKISNALEYYQKSLDLFESIRNRREMALIYLNIGAIYDNQKDTTKAFFYNKKALDIQLSIGDKNGMANSYNNMGTIYNNQKNTLKALEYHQKSLALRESLDDKYGIAISNLNIAVSYGKSGEYSKAIKYCKRSLNIRETLGDQLGIALCNNTMGSIYLNKNQIDSAFYYSRKSLNIAKELNYPDEIRKAAQNLSEIYFAKNDYKTGHSYYELYIQMRDSIYNEENTKQITRLETRYEIEKQIEKQKKMEEGRRKTEEVALSRRNNLQLMGSFIVIIVALLGAILLGRFHVPLRVIEGVMFVSFILFYELIGVFADPFIETMTGGAPAIKLVINAVIAVVLYGLNSWVERGIKGRLGRSHSTEANSERLN